jgi:hypothetical protein
MKKNPYLEIVVRGALKSTEPEPGPADALQANSWKWNDSAPAKPFVARSDRSQKALVQLRDANAGTQLDVCDLP